MFIISNLLEAIAVILNTVLNLYLGLVIISAVLSWVRPDPYNPIVRFIYGLTEPVFYKIRRWLPFVVIGGIDLSPIVVLLIIQFLKIFLVNSLDELSVRL